MVKEKIRETFEKECEEKKRASTKLRFLQKKAVDTYMNKVSKVDVRMALIIRLNMVEHITGNYGAKQKCILCDEDDSTEHIFVCPKIENKEQVTVDELKNGEKMEEIVRIFAKAEEERRKVMVGNLLEHLET